MAFKLFSDVRETSTAPGTSAFALNGAYDGSFFAFSSKYSNGDTGHYYAKGAAGREIGKFTYNSSGNTLTRSVIKSTNSDAAVNFSAGAVDIAVTNIAPSDLTGSQLAELTALYGPPIVPNYLTGLGLSTAGGNSSFVVSAGFAADSTNAELMNLASALTKSTSSWAVGTAAGALDTGTIANNTWYHVFLIKRSDTGVVDVLVSTSVSAPTMPTNYDRKRRIGSLKTDGSAHWVGFQQVGDYFTWNTTVQAANGTACSATPANLTVETPPGIVTLARMSILLSASAATYVYLYQLARGSQSAQANPLNASVATNTSIQIACVCEVLTDTSSQIGVVSQNANGNYYVGVYGYIDRRGREG